MPPPEPSSRRPSRYDRTPATPEQIARWAADAQRELQNNPPTYARPADGPAPDESGMPPDHLSDDEVTTDWRAQQVRSILQELASRRIEALRLYEPLPVGMAFHNSPSRMRLARGSNRSGKTLVCAVEVARAVTGQDPNHRYPATDGVFFIVGTDWKEHIGNVVWRKLARAGAFKIVRDPHTNLWRALRPWSPEDMALKHLAKPAPPLIPPRLISQIDWFNKKASVPKLVKLHNGWELHFFSSLGKAPQGGDIDGFWLDEEIIDETWLPELQARIIDREGCGMWSATPQAGTDQLYDLHEQAQRDSHRTNPRVAEFHMLLEDNPHLSEQAKRDFVDSLSEEERIVRVSGEYAILSHKVYPEFSMLRHGMDYAPIPNDWTRFAVFDPGHQVCAVLFAAVPPPDVGEFVELYDELYLLNCNAAMLGNEMRKKLDFEPEFEEFIIDSHMALHTEMGVGLTVMEQYSEVFRELNIKSRRTKHSFILASDDVRAGVMAVHGWLMNRDEEGPRLRVRKESCPNLIEEFRRYVKKRVAGVVVDEPNQRRRNHLMDCVRYLAMRNPYYVKPPKRKEALRGAAAILQRKREKKREKMIEDGSYMINLGPGRR